MNATQRRYERNGKKWLSPAESVEINKRLLRYIRAVDAGEDITWADVARELDLRVDVVHTRVMRIRRGKGKFELPPEPCDCDEHGPCLKHFRQGGT
jgi:hypothetical protein